MAYKFSYIPKSSPETVLQEMARLDRENWEAIERADERVACRYAHERNLDAEMRAAFRRALATPLIRG